MSRLFPALVALSGLLLPLSAQQAPSPETGSKEPLNSPLWPKRVGKLNFADAVKLLGKPKKLAKNKDGTQTAVWENQIEYRSVDQFPQTTTMDRGHMTAPPSNSGVISFKTERLTLAFDPTNLLAAWSYKKP